MVNISMRRLGLVVLSAVLLTSVLAWRLQASGPTMAMLDFSSSPVPPSHRIYLPTVMRNHTAAPALGHKIYLPMVVR
jgi:hypothetical protein